MSEVQRVEKISGVADTKDSTYYSSRGHHDSGYSDGKSFNNLLMTYIYKQKKKDEESEKKEDKKANMDKVDINTADLFYYENMRRVKETFNHPEEEQNNEVDPKVQNAINKYDDNMERASKAYLFRARCKISSEKVDNAKSSEKKENNKNIEENER